jgi:hypothetical protein
MSWRRAFVFALCLNNIDYYIRALANCQHLFETFFEKNLKKGLHSLKKYRIIIFVGDTHHGIPR